VVGPVQPSGGARRLLTSTDGVSNDSTVAGGVGDGAASSASPGAESETGPWLGSGAGVRVVGLAPPSGSGSPKNCHRLPMLLPHKSRSSSNDCNSGVAGVGGVCETMG